MAFIIKILVAESLVLKMPKPCWDGFLPIGLEDALKKTLDYHLNHAIDELSQET